LRIHKQRIDLGRVRERGIGERLMQISAMLITDFVGEPGPTAMTDQLEMSLILRIQPYHTLLAPKLDVRYKCTHRLHWTIPAEWSSGRLKRAGDHPELSRQVLGESGHPRFPDSVHRQVPG
jgi:hypothetical protein